MPSKVPEKSALQVKRLANKPGLHNVGGVTGLYLSVKPPAATSWILKRKVGAKRREMGLGPYPDITLSRARDKAREYMELVESGVDPIAERKARQSALAAAQRKEKTFRDVAAEFIKKKSTEFKTAKQVQKLTSHLETYVYPSIGNLVVADIERAHIVSLLEPIWFEKNETAQRVRATVERVLDLATVKGLRTAENPARWKGNLDLSLPLPGKVSKVQHYKSLPYSELPEFMAELKGREGMGAKALHFAILTAARSGEVRNATWDEIDLKAKVWTIPAERMKNGRQHRVPLSASAVALLKELPRDSEIVFPNTKGAALSDMTLGKVLKSMDYSVTAHGFRSTFRTWAQECTSYPDEVPELSLAHVNSDRTRAAYARSELIDKRRQLMADWEQFIHHGKPKGKVVSMRKRRNG